MTELIGSVVFGLHLLAGVAKVVALLATGEAGETFAQVLVGEVIGRLFVLTFFVWMFQKGRPEG